MKTYARAYASESKANVAYLMKNIYTIESKDAKIGIGFGKDVQASEACYGIMKKARSQISIYVNGSTGQAHMRSKKGFYCLTIAQGETGGGHPNAAGFPTHPERYGNKFDKMGMEMFVSYLKRKYGNKSMKQGKETGARA